MANPGRACASCLRVEEVVGPLRTIATSANTSSHVCASCDARRVIDPKLIPTKAPAPVTVTLLRALADRIGMDARAHAANIAAAIELAIVELNAGRLEGFLMAMTDIERASSSMHRSINAPASSTVDAVASLDPAYNETLRPVREEISLSRSAASLESLDLPTLRASLQVHELGCSDRNCTSHRAFRRALAARGVS